MRTGALIMILAGATLIVGCGESERLESELAAARTEVARMDSTLTASQAQAERTSDRVNHLTGVLATAQAERDSLAASLQTAQQRTGQLERNLQDTRVLFDRTRDSLQALNTALTENVSRLVSEVQAAEGQVASLELELGRFRNQRDSLYAFVDDVRPWYEYYKHESRRNWLKKLFGAGDAKKPTIPEPTFGPATPPADLEVQVP